MPQINFPAKTSQACWVKKRKVIYCCFQSTPFLWSWVRVISFAHHAGAVDCDAGRANPFATAESTREEGEKTRGKGKGIPEIQPKKSQGTGVQDKTAQEKQVQARYGYHQGRYPRVETKENERIEKWQKRRVHQGERFWGQTGQTTNQYRWWERVWVFPMPPSKAWLQNLPPPWLQAEGTPEKNQRGLWGKCW